MLPDSRAVVFDMDDTLYPYRHYRLSGFRAVAAHLERTRGIDRRIAYARLTCAAREGSRGRELQICLEEWDLGAGVLVELLDVIQRHEPVLKLPSSAVRMFRLLRDGGWRVGVLTNGPPAVQERKVAALGLTPLVDAVVYATAFGCGVGKPERPPFAEVSRRLGVTAAATVFVGDDERCDIAGAIDAGMHAVRCCAWVAGARQTRAAVVIDRLSVVPDIAGALLEEGTKRHAA